MRKYFILYLTVLWTFLLLRPALGQWSMEDSNKKTWPDNAEMRVSFVPGTGTPTDTNQIRLLLMVRSETERHNVSPIIKGTNLERWTVEPKTMELRPNQNALFYVTLYPKSNVHDLPQINIRMPWHSEKDAISFTTPLFQELSQNPWESCYRGEKAFPSTNELAPDFFKSTDQWKPILLPNMWPELGITWLRLRFPIDKKFQGYPLELYISAIDDNDMTWFNGKKIGGINGWDTPRHYSIPSDLIRFDGENELIIGVNNNNAGGGIKDAPIRLGVIDKNRENKSTKGSIDISTAVLFSNSPLQHESSRTPSRSPAPPMPLRPMIVRNGVLEYKDGGEVALWGSNYYPQSWNQYRSLKNRGIDPKEALKADFTDFAPLDAETQANRGTGPNRFNVIRIHVFDTEISDEAGNLVQNEHLDILDALVAECNKRGVYLWLTPIAWWGSPNSLKNTFSGNTAMPAMMLDESVRQKQINYYHQFLNHVNPHTKRALKNEPCLVLFELINEPLYWQYAQVKNYDQEKTEKTKYWKEKVYHSWLKELPSPDWACQETWNYYCYTRVLSYINDLYQVIRSQKANQPVGYHASSWSSPSWIHQAIADSNAEAITLNFYSGLQQKPESDKKSFLNKTYNVGIPEILSKKARLVYEFDASDTLKQIDLYPALARYWRELGVQVACQFQYDSQFTADINQDWVTHYLNYRHTPSRIASFLIAGQVFRVLPRGTKIQPKDPDQLIFPPAAVCWSKNAALFCSSSLYMQARTTDWTPLARPEAPQSIIAVGSTPYYDYNGTGLVLFSAHENEALLRIFPNVIRYRDDVLSGTPEKPLTALSMEPQTFQWKMEKWKNAKLERQTESGWQELSEKPDHFHAVPGLYRLKLPQ